MLLSWTPGSDTVVSKWLEEKLGTLSASFIVLKIRLVWMYQGLTHKPTPWLQRRLREKVCINISEGTLKWELV